jgi:hypothetical protein
MIVAAAACALALAPGAGAWSWPVEGTVLRPFAFGDDPYAAGQHRGIDIAADRGGTVRAPVGGTVSFAGTVPGGGKTVTLRTQDGYAVTLVHLGSIGVLRGAVVSEGETVGTIGPSGEPEVDVPYVHLGVRVADEEHGYVDPLLLLPTRTAADEAGSVPPSEVAEAPALEGGPPVTGSETEATPVESGSAEPPEAPAAPTATHAPLPTEAVPIPAEPAETPVPEEPEPARPVATPPADAVAPAPAAVSAAPATWNAPPGVPGQSDGPLAATQAPAPEAVGMASDPVESSPASAPAAPAESSSAAVPGETPASAAPAAPPVDAPDDAADDPDADTDADDDVAPRQAAAPDGPESVAVVPARGRPTTRRRVSPPALVSARRPVSGPALVPAPRLSPPLRSARPPGRAGREATATPSRAGRTTAARSGETRARGRAATRPTGLVSARPRQGAARGARHAVRPAAGGREAWIPVLLVVGCLLAVAFAAFRRRRRGGSTAVDPRGRMPSAPRAIGAEPAPAPADAPDLLGLQPLVPGPCSHGRTARARAQDACGTRRRPVYRLRRHHARRRRVRALTLVRSA